MSAAAVGMDVGEDRLERLRAELRSALAQTDRAVVTAWAQRSALRVPSGIGRRGLRLGVLTVRVAKAVVVEAWGAAKAGNRGEFVDHTKRRAAAAVASSDAAVQQARDCMAYVAGLARLLTTQPEKAAPELLGLGLGFLGGSGGLDGDGGIPDLDLLPSIGWHRSILTHSIVAGAVAEALLAAFLDLVLVVHARLPRVHDPLWDTLARIALRTAAAARIGVDAGIATHLLIDGTVNGMTPYKDVPVALPLEVHRGILLANAATEADFAAEGLSRLARKPSKAD